MTPMLSTCIMVFLHFQVGLNLFDPKMHITRIRGASKNVTSSEGGTPWMDTNNLISMKAKPLDSHMVS